MDTIKIVPMTLEQAKTLGIDRWSRWECEPSVFDWYYDAQEAAFVFEGDVTVTVDGKAYHLGPNMLVSFPQGMSCTWEVKKTIKKAYAFNVDIG